MVAMIHTIRGLYNAFRYNERKIDNDKASFLYAMNFATPDDTLTARQRLRRLEERARLNHRVRVTCVSIKLTFDLAEELDADLLTKVSKSYMERMGFADQPYLAYEHKDAPTPHLHILVSPICRDGTVIPINLRKKELSKQTTQELEREFDLVRFHEHERLHFRGDRSLGINDVNYNNGPRGPLVNTILSNVLTDYKFTSLEEFNALLRPYRLMADRGKPGSNIYEHRGLVYRPLDEEGNPLMSYLKASKLEGKPTLAFLEKRFEQHRLEQAAYLNRVRVAVDWSLFPVNNRHIDRLREDLRREGIEIYWRLPKDQGTPSLCYVDYQARWAFGETVMGESYTATALLRRCQLDPQGLALALYRTRDQSAKTPAEDSSVQWNKGLSLMLSRY